MLVNVGSVMESGRGGFQSIYGNLRLPAGGSRATAVADSENLNG